MRDTAARSPTTEIRRIVLIDVLFSAASKALNSGAAIIAR
jgi:hypothetical protein